MLSKIFPFLSKPRQIRCIDLKLQHRGVESTIPPPFFSSSEKYETDAKLLPKSSVLCLKQQEQQQKTTSFPQETISQ